MKKKHLGIRVLDSNHLTYDDSEQNHDSNGQRLVTTLTPMIHDFNWTVAF